MESSKHRENSDLSLLLDTLRRRAWIVVLALVIAVAVGYAIARAGALEYQSTAVLLFRPLQLDAQVTGIPLEVGAGDSGVDAATNVGLVGLQQVRARAAAALGGAVSEQFLQTHVTIAQQGQSDLVDIVGSASTAAQAQRIAEALATQFVALRNQQIGAAIRKAAAKLQRQQELSDLPSTKAGRQAADTAAQKLDVLAALGSQEAQIAQRAEPPENAPTRHTGLTLILGAIIGLLVGLGSAFAIETLDRRLRRPEQVADATALPLLAAVPRPRRGRAATGELEAYRRLRANISHLPTGGPRSVLITSAGAESGKTTVALNLATAAAASGMRVFLIEADLRRPRLASLLSLPAGDGLSAVLDGSRNGDGAVPWIDVPFAATGSDGRTRGSLQILAAGSSSNDATELIDSGRMRTLLTQATQESDLVIVDAPPPSLVADAIALTSQVDGVIVVGRLGRDSRDGLERLTEELRDIGATTLGVVATFAQRRRSPYDQKRR